MTDVAGNEGTQVIQTTDGSTVTVEAEIITSSAELIESGLVIFPNPATDQFNIELSDSSKADVLVLFTISGKEIYRDGINGKVTIVNTENFSSGLYLLALIKDGSVVSKKKIKIK